MPASPRSLSIQALAIFAAASVLYLATGSCSLDDWDSVQFVLGVERFDVVAHRPHPPGYPLLIATAKVLRLVADFEATTALRIVSALGGGLMVAAWFAAVAWRFGAALGWASALALAGTPGLWLTATKALSDAPAAGLLVAAAGLACSASPRALGLAAVVAALAAGFRAHHLPVAAAIILLALGLGRARPGQAARTLTLFAAATLAWLAPLVWIVRHASGGSGPGWLGLVGNQVAWGFDKPDVSALATGFASAHLLARLRTHGLDIVGWDLGFAPTSWAGGIGLALWLGGIWCFARRWRRDEAAAKFAWFHWVWAGVALALAFAMLPAHRRYFLPLLPALLFPAQWGLWARGRHGRAAAWVIALVPWTIAAPWVFEAHRVAAPPVLLVRDVVSRHPPEELPQVLLILDSAFRHAHHYAPTCRVRHVDRRLRAARLLDPRRVAIYTDVPDLVERWDLEGFTLEPLGTWERSPHVHDKHTRAELFRVVRRPSESAAALYRGRAASYARVGAVHGHEGHSPFRGHAVGSW